MKKLFILLFTVFSLQSVHADEGMWLLNMLAQLDIQSKGSVLTPEQIYSVNESCVKDAIVGLGEEDRPFNFFCTAEIVSDQGLVLTNYHCAFDMIQKLSSIDQNLIDDGFWAKNKSEELPTKGITATIVKRIIDVSDTFMPLYKLEGKSWQEIQDTITIVRNAMVQQVLDTSDYYADILPFFEHNQYIMFVYEKFEDVRLVGAPPRTIGKFGGDTDNWMWPRHTGDFAVLRIYGDKNSKPAAYSEKNVAITPKHHLPVSIKGYEKGDYTFVMGFPGSTDRYKTSFGVEALLRYNNSSVITIGDRMLEIYRYFMNSSEQTRIQYSSKYDRISNYWKYAIGQNKGIIALDVIGQKITQEKELVGWILEDSARKEEYADVLVALQKHYAATKEANYAFNFINIGLLRAVEFSTLVYNTFPLLDAIEANDPVEIAIQKRELKELVLDHFKDYNIIVDKAQFIAMSQLIVQYVPEKYHPEHFAMIKKKYKGDFAKYAEKLYAKSMFMNQEKMLAFIENPSLETFKKDIGYSVLRSTIIMYYGLDGIIESPTFDETRQSYLEAVLAFNTDSLFYPDANSTIRYTYGYVGDYKPRDGVYYNYYTTLKGVVEKEDSTNQEFVAPKKLIDLYNQKDYGQYANSKGELPLCFISNNDITGGNSGSPIMNANGELLGLAFDGNWEAMSGDIIFENEYQKCISVDIRYVLFIIDKFAGAGYLVDEMTIVK